MQSSLPEFTKWINPVLYALKQLGGSARPGEVVELVAKNENVPDSVLDQLNPAGGQRFSNQVHWARFGNPPIFSSRQKWSYAVKANFCMGVMPPSAMFGRSWL